MEDANELAIRTLEETYKKKQAKAKKQEVQEQVKTIHEAISDGVQDELQEDNQPVNTKATDNLLEAAEEYRLEYEEKYSKLSLLVDKTTAMQELLYEQQTQLLEYNKTLNEVLKAKIEDNLKK
jgi:hypothetical protein